MVYLMMSISFLNCLMLQDKGGDLLKMTDQRAFFFLVTELFYKRYNKLIKSLYDNIIIFFYRIFFYDLDVLV